MTPKQRLLAAILGKDKDRVPFSPFLAYYFQSLSAEIQQKGELQYIEEMGADPLLRGAGCAFQHRNEKCSEESKTEKDKSYHKLITPVGTLNYTRRYSKAGDTWFLDEHPVKTAEDLKILRYYFETLEVVPKIDEFNSYHAEIGERALALPIIGTNAKTAFQSLIEHWVGTVELMYLISDEPGEVEETLAVMCEKDKIAAEYSAMSNAEGFISWEDTSTTNYSPELYNKYIAPQITEWCEILKNSGKFYVQHACGHLRALLPAMAEQGITAVESIPPYPTGNLTMEDAARLIPKNVAVIGGIEPTDFLNKTEEEIAYEAEKLLKIFENRPFVLANSDSCPPGVTYEKFKLLADIVKKRP